MIRSGRAILEIGAVGLAMWLTVVGGPAAADELGLDRLEHFTTRDGLSQDWILNINQDRQGFLWVGTDDGLNRYDGYRFQVYRHDPDDPSSISGNFVICTFEDRSGTLWVGTSQGLNRLDRATGRFDRFHYDPDLPRSLRHDFTTAIHEDQRGVLWVGTMHGLDRFDSETDSFQRVRLEPDEPDRGSPGFVRILESRRGELWVTRQGKLYRFDPTALDFERIATFEGEGLWTLAEDREGRLWIGTNGGDLLGVDPASGQSTRHSFEEAGIVFVSDILPRPDGSLWLGTEDHGLVVFDPERGIRTTHRHEPDEPGSLSDERVMTIFEDRTGILWIGTEAGLDKLDPAHSRFSHLRHRRGDPESLSADWISVVMEDSRGDLWVGSGGHGLNRFDHRTGRNTRYRHDPTDPGSLGNENVMAVLEGSDGIYWLGTHAGIERFDPRSGRFTRPGQDFSVQGEMPDDWIYELVESEPGVVWIGWNGGLDRFDTRTLEVWHYEDDPEDSRDLGIPFVYSLWLDRQGNLWVGTSGSGLFFLDLQAADVTTAGPKEVWRFSHDADDLSSLASDTVASIYEDQNGTLWIGTFGGGLNRLGGRGSDGAGDPANFEFTRFREKDGLANDNIHAILEDDDGHLWLSSHRGLTRFDPRTGRCKNFGLEDGLQGTAFLLGAAAKRASGELLFGGIGGLNGFFPEALIDDPHPPHVAITDFRLSSRSFPLAARRSSPKGEDLRLTFSHQDRIIGFEFAALHFAKPGKNRYAHQLEGFSDEWIETGARDRLAQYTDLDAGDYVFRVKAANADGLWGEEGAALRIQVLPPPWKTWWAYSLYALALAAVVVGYVRSHRRELERERQVSRRLREIDKLKDDFLANTSHELRTPLYGMTGLAESLLDGAEGDLNDGVRGNLSMIVASGRRLGHLVNDILDFSKLRHKSLELDRRPVELHGLVDVVLILSAPLVGEKPLRLENTVPQDLPAADADENRLQQILYNLIGNAIKFTEEGVVEVSAAAVDDRVEVRVRDTGIGIAPEKQEKIFDAFEQADGSVEREYGGTGLGLAVTRQLVELHGGTIRVQSQVGEGSTFTFDVPITKSEAQTEGSEEHRISVLPMSPTMPSPSGAGGFANPDAVRILAVDDEPVNRQVMKNFLALESFDLVTAASGEEALGLIEEERFDLVLLDVMMPKVSGYEVCRALREKYPKESLPVLFLTAKNQASDVVTGLSLGANDFLTKPVARDELLARLRPHLDLLDTHRHLEDLVEEKVSKIKILEGILPICSRCKKIRDDDGGWSPLESYIDSHSEAHFSHGICPTCMDDYYDRRAGS